MKIDLGKHETHVGVLIRAWIEPNFPALRIGTVRDSGFLCVEQIDAKPGDAVISPMRLESMSEHAWKLQYTVGVELARHLWEERQKYNRRPYYLIYDHAQYGRLYFDAAAGDAVAFGTRPQAAYAEESVSFDASSAPERLQALFVHEKLAKRSPLLPSSDELAHALQSAKQLATLVMQMRANYAAAVDWEFDKRLASVMVAASGRSPLTDPEDIQRYEALSARALRPADDSVDDYAEFARWFSLQDHTPRLEPLPTEELEQCLNAAGFDTREAGIAAQRLGIADSDWEWLKDKRLGRLRKPVEVIQRLMQYEGTQPSPDTAWLKNAFHAADFCTNVPISPAKVVAVLEEYVALRERAADKTALAGDPGYAAATSAIRYLRDPENGLSTAFELRQEASINTPTGTPDTELQVEAEDCGPSP